MCVCVSVRVCGSGALRECKALSLSHKSPGMPKDTTLDSKIAVAINSVLETNVPTKHTLILKTLGDVCKKLARERFLSSHR